MLFGSKGMSERELKSVREINAETLEKMMDDLKMSFDTVYQDCALTNLVQFAYQCGKDEGLFISRIPEN